MLLRAIWIFLLIFPSIASFAQQIEWNLQPGVYAEPPVIQMSASPADASIFFTTDGSDPLENGTLYEGPFELGFLTDAPNILSLIPTNNLNPGHPYRENWTAPEVNVQKLHSIRSIAVLPSGQAGEEKTGSFLVHPDGSQRYSFPIVSLISPADNFFGHENGIYVPGSTGGNYYQRGRQWERPLHVEFFDEEGELEFGLNAGVRIHGGTSRNRPRKSLRLYARSDYGTSWIQYPVFPDKGIDRYKRLLLRNSGNDWSESLFRDAYMQRLVRDFSMVDIQYSRAVLVFINGEYWGIHNIRDRFDARYLQSHYGLHPDRVSVLEGPGNPDHGDEQGAAHYAELIRMAEEENPQEQEVFENLSLLMDMGNFIDYQILHIYTRNTDWPGNNVAFWRYMDGEATPGEYHPADGRWRWMAFDLDFGFGLDFDYVFNSGSSYGGNDAFHNTLAFSLEENGPGWPNPPWSTLLFRRLMMNESFKNRFVNRFADHLNTVFRAERAGEVLNGFKDAYQAEIHEHVDRWNEPSLERWESNVETMRVFAQLREPIMRNHLNNTLNLGGAVEVEISREPEAGGVVRVNSLVLSPSLPGLEGDIYPWRGTYFRAAPIELEAIPEAGYRFEGWSGHTHSTEPIIEVHPEAGIRIEAHFVRTDDFQGDSMNPAPHVLSEGPYWFNYWSPEEPEGNFPPNMIFQQSDQNDPMLNDEMVSPYLIPFNSPQDNEYHANDQDKFGFPYSLTGRTRINGLNDRGISMINTGRGRDLGAAVLALNTESVDEVLIDWEAGTEQANSRVYHIRLQYRIGLQEEWQDIVDESGEVVEYQRSFSNHSTQFQNILLPEDALGRPYVQLRWKYYFTGTRLTEDSGRRDELRLDNIYVRSRPVFIEELPEIDQWEILSVDPNPSSGEVSVRLMISKSTLIEVELLDSMGRLIDKLFQENVLEGRNELNIQIPNFHPGFHYLRIRDAAGRVVVRKILLAR